MESASNQNNYGGGKCLGHTVRDKGLIISGEQL